MTTVNDEILTELREFHQQWVRVFEEMNRRIRQLEEQVAQISEPAL